MTNNLQLLTDREKEVVQLLSLGLTYEKIAGKINVSHETVKMHLKNIYRKLDDFSNAWITLEGPLATALI